MARRLGRRRRSLLRPGGSRTFTVGGVPTASTPADIDGSGVFDTTSRLSRPRGASPASPTATSGVATARPWTAPPGRRAASCVPRTRRSPHVVVALSRRQGARHRHVHPQPLRGRQARSRCEVVDNRRSFRAARQGRDPADLDRDGLGSRRDLDRPAVDAQRHRDLRRHVGDLHRRSRRPQHLDHAPGHRHPAGPHADHLLSNAITARRAAPPRRRPRRASVASRRSVPPSPAPRRRGTSRACSRASSGCATTSPSVARARRRTPCGPRTSTRR